MYINVFKNFQHIKLKTLDCLELMVKRCNSAVLIPYQSFTVQAIKKVSGSKKEVMRKKAATVRNLWYAVKFFGRSIIIFRELLKV